MSPNHSKYLLNKISKKFFFLLFFTTLFINGDVVAAARIKSNHLLFTPDEIVVKFTESILSKSVKKTINRSGAKVLREIPEIGATVLQVVDGDTNSSLDYLIQQENVIYAEPNYLAEITDVIPNDPGWGNQYNLAAIHAPQGWALDTGAVWVTIAIVDSGVDLTHPDLFVRILPGYDFVNNDAIAQDDNGHGTHVAAIAAASSNNAVGISGVNWGANILPVKVLNASGNGTYANVAAGIVWATDHGAQVINLSLGGASPSFVLNDAVNYAYQRGVILVASTGNAGISGVLYPAAYDPVIAVGATDSTNSWAGFSNFGPEVDVVAPGVNIYSAYPGGGYGYRSGTSMSTPHVSGLAAILWGIPGNGPVNIRTIIEGTAHDLGNPGWDEYFGYGIIQMDAAIQQALPPDTSTPSTIPTEELQAAPPMQTGSNLQTVTILPNTFTPEALSSPTSTTEPEEVSALDQKTATPAAEFIQANGVESGYVLYILPCGGIFLILLGGLLFWSTRRGKSRLKSNAIRL